MIALSTQLVTINGQLSNVASVIGAIQASIQNVAADVDYLKSVAAGQVAPAGAGDPEVVTDLDRATAAAILTKSNNLAATLQGIASALAAIDVRVNPPQAPEPLGR